LRIGSISGRRGKEILRRRHVRIRRLLRVTISIAVAAVAVSRLRSRRVRRTFLLLVLLLLLLPFPTSPTFYVLPFDRLKLSKVRTLILRSEVCLIRRWSERRRRRSEGLRLLLTREIAVGDCRRWSWKRVVGVGGPVVIDRGLCLPIAVR